MTRIAVIGSSHVGAIRQAWDILAKEYPNLDMRFFAAHSGLVAHMTLDRNLSFGLHSTKGLPQKSLDHLTRNFGSHTIDLASADVVLRVGWSINEIAIAQLLADFDCDGHNPKSGRPRLSLPAFQAFSQAVATKAAEKRDWQNWSKPRLFVLPVPRLAENCLGSTAEHHAVWRRLVQNGGAGTGLDYYANVAQQALAAKGITLILQPNQVFSASGLTKEEYSRNSYRLLMDEAHQEDDHVHMNAIYGEIVLKNALDRILSASNLHTTGA